MINVGFLRSRKQPIKFAEILAKKSTEKGINLVYLTPEDIHIEEKMVTGLIYRDKEWVEEKIRLPQFIDIHADLLGGKKYKELIGFLKEHATLSAKTCYPLPRTRFERYFKEGSFFYENVIMRKKIESLEDIKVEAERHGSITLQPTRQGKEVSRYVVKHVQGEYKVYRRIDGELLPEGLSAEEFLQAIGEVRYGAEKFIPPVEGTFEEADCNVQMEKGAAGEWEIVRMEMRQADKSTLQSYINDAFPENAVTLLEDVEAFVHHFAKTIERIRKSSYMSISINIVLDKNGNIFVRKVVPNPSVVGVEETIARLRSDYYSYIAPPLEMTEDEEMALETEREANKKIEEELVEFHEEEERKRKLIEAGLLKEEKAKFTIFSVLIIIAIIFAMIRFSMRSFM